MAHASVTVMTIYASGLLAGYFLFSMARSAGAFLWMLLKSRWVSRVLPVPASSLLLVPGRYTVSVCSRASLDGDLLEGGFASHLCRARTPPIIGLLGAGEYLPNGPRTASDRDAPALEPPCRVALRSAPSLLGLRVCSHLCKEGASLEPSPGLHPATKL